MLIMDTCCLLVLYRLSSWTQDDGNGGVWVHSNKQGFQDCEAYAELEDWLGKKADEYWDKYFDPVQLVCSINNTLMHT